VTIENAVLGQSFRIKNVSCVPSPLGLTLVPNRTGKHGVDLKDSFMHLSGL